MTKRKVFVSYHHADAVEVRAFVDEHRSVMIPRGIGDGVTDDDNFIGSDDTEYVLRRIREKYLSDSTVTVVMIGKCTWARKYVDWEIAASLRNDADNGRSGLLAMLLPSLRNNPPTVPQRISDNARMKGDSDGYGRYHYAPSSSTELAGWLEDAADARFSRAHLIKSPRSPLRAKNSPC
jgi:hypothetical protein